VANNKNNIVGNTDVGRYFLDITQDVCPLTFVKAKLLLERMEPGAVAEIRLNSGEPLENVPRSVREEGHEVVSLGPEEDGAEGAKTVYRMVVRKR
jgi:TusA-related sulfurtransferase